MYKFVIILMYVKACMSFKLNSIGENKENIISYCNDKHLWLLLFITGKYLMDFRIINNKLEKQL